MVEAVLCSLLPRADCQVPMVRAALARLIAVNVRTTNEEWGR